MDAIEIGLTEAQAREYYGTQGPVVTEHGPVELGTRVALDDGESGVKFEFFNDSDSPEEPDVGFIIVDEPTREREMAPEPDDVSALAFYEQFYDADGESLDVRVHYPAHPMKQASDRFYSVGGC